MKKLLITPLLLAVCFISFVTFADSGKGHGNNKDHDKKSERYYRGSSDRSTTIVVIGDDDRIVLRDYVRGFCPPGLAKKHNGCTPPGHAKKYKIGGYLTDDIDYVSLPVGVLVKLRPVPEGYRYVRVDNDVLLISEASKKIIDAVTLLSAVNG